MERDKRDYQLVSNILSLLKFYFYGEFDPGSGRTLAACLIHASRADELLVLAPTVR